MGGLEPAAKNQGGGGSGEQAQQRDNMEIALSREVSTDQVIEFECMQTTLDRSISLWGEMGPSSGVASSALLIRLSGNWSTNYKLSVHRFPNHD